MNISTLVSSSKGLLDSAEYLYDHIEDDDYSRNPNKYAFILSCAAALESMLNDGIVSWAFHTFPRDHYKRHATAFLSMNLGKKLDALGYLFSTGTCITDNTSQQYQTLISLIKLRNEVAHSKDFFIDNGTVEVGYDDEVRSYQFSNDVVSKFNKSPLSIERERCADILGSLKDLWAVLHYDVDAENSPLFKAL
ncbi:hypothetical protein CGH22_24990 [Vibrio parahaemolyticus]|uniref:hypothetical protein n=1 Tax=Vibrio parahaemolyticus TaxID=670 RepID=UPI00111D3A39|nr:hypothetical protein [Vibrio parahaemolyticus]ELP2658934.1 hypothetical protein [Vibrio parahaemolyticus]TOP11313.1 hypothetical protein CGH22_24990 [Vibrio parahaemolyticus]TOQ46999.1 hypothetical protein CGG94_25270 [Vibrio parahaemolyticus]HCG7544739.1 hypothetical protein [Vibrio parahaemolyticus]HCH0359017.1 hypothetical protein [Vibrio parahaemolyticus]